MKRYLFIIIVLIVVGCKNGSSIDIVAEGKVDSVIDVVSTIDSINTQSSITTDEAEISFNEYEYAFGTIKKGKEVSHTFVYTNIGNVPLVIYDVIPACGCTASEYSKEPIYPGDKGEIKITFDTRGYKGLQTKSITVKSNAKNNLTLLRIIAQIQ